MALLSAIILTLGECIFGKISQSIYKRYLWNYTNRNCSPSNPKCSPTILSFCTFCDGYNSLSVSIFLFLLSYGVFYIFDKMNIRN